MAVISIISAKYIEVQYDAITKLQEKCESCELLRGKKSTYIGLYAISGRHVTNDGPAMLAIAEYSKNT